jgi:hypothetical protein
MTLILNKNFKTNFEVDLNKFNFGLVGSHFNSLCFTNSIVTTEHHIFMKNKKQKLI